MRSPCEPFRTQVESPVSCFPTGDPHSVAVPLHHLHRSSHFFVNTGYDMRSSQQWWLLPFKGFAPALPPASKALQPIFYLLRNPLSCKAQLLCDLLCKPTWPPHSDSFLPPQNEWHLVYTIVMSPVMHAFDFSLPNEAIECNRICRASAHSRCSLCICWMNTSLPSANCAMFPCILLMTEPCLLFFHFCLV